MSVEVILFIAFKYDFPMQLYKWPYINVDIYNNRFIIHVFGIPNFLFRRVVRYKRRKDVLSKCTAFAM